MLARIYSGALVGLDSTLVEVEVDVASMGMPSFAIVGLPDKAVEEAKDRVHSAIKNSGANFPSHRITVNLAPADLPKEGPSYDLAIALGILLASGQIPQAPEALESSLVFGELSLDGSLRPVRGVLSHAIMARQKKIHKLYLPQDNAEEGSLIEAVKSYPLKNLKDIYFHLSDEIKIQPLPQFDLSRLFSEDKTYTHDLADVKGQEQAKRALEIAAAGGHNLFFKGVPGAGKTLLARSLPSILPKLTLEEALEVTKIYSAADLLPKDNPLFLERAFRSPHHSASSVGLLGGGTYPKPGEISLAHRGVLFLDEFPEFPRSVLESLRQPLEDGYATISRARGTHAFPARFMLVAAANPCPCGYLGDVKKACHCAPSQVTRYQKKISGPILDRIDLQVEVPAVDTEKLTSDGERGESSQEVRARVELARQKQEALFKGTPFFCNSDLNLKGIKEFCKLTDEAKSFLKEATSKLGLSARSYYKTVKVSKTIQDLEGKEQTEVHHLAEALQYRFRQET